MVDVPAPGGAQGAPTLGEEIRGSALLFLLLAAVAGGTCLLGFLIV
jgi:hypothetical protein